MPWSHSESQLGFDSPFPHLLFPGKKALRGTNREIEKRASGQHENAEEVPRVLALTKLSFFVKLVPTSPFARLPVATAQAPALVTLGLNHPTPSYPSLQPPTYPITRGGVGSDS